MDIEGDYLLDVVPREMGPSGHHPLALRAQAIVARTYAYCVIHTWEQPGGGEGDPYWGNCLREIDNSNRFQVFVPYHFDRLTSDDQQAVQDAVAEVAYLIDAEEPERGPIFAEFSADAYLRTAARDDDQGAGAAVDSAGYAYVVGTSNNGDWGSTPITDYSAGLDGFLAQLDPDGALLWHTFVGGSETNSAHAVTRDDAGNIFVAGGAFCPLILPFLTSSRG